MQMRRGAAAADKRVKHGPIAFPFCGEFYIRIGEGTTGHVLLPGFFSIADKKLRVKSGDSFQRVAYAAQVKRYGRMITEALNDEVPASLSQFVEKAQAVPGRKLGEQQPVFLLRYSSYVVVHPVFYLLIHILVELQ